MTRFSQTNSARLPLPFALFTLVLSPSSLSPPKLRGFDFFRADRGEELEYSYSNSISVPLPTTERKGSLVLCGEKDSDSLSYSKPVRSFQLCATRARTHSPLSLSLSSRASLHREDISLRRSFSQSECSLISFEPFAPE